jgi:hypothetical protein
MCLVLVVVMGGRGLRRGPGKKCVGVGGGDGGEGAEARPGKKCVGVDGGGGGRGKL